MGKQGIRPQVFVFVFVFVTPLRVLLQQRPAVRVFGRWPTP